MVTRELPEGSTTDVELMDQVRGGDLGAYAFLYEKHVPVAMRAALRVAGPSHADDVVSDAFTKVFIALRSGSGPRVDFRSYLLACVNNAWVDRVRRDSHAVPVEHETLVPLLTVDDDTRQIAEHHLLADALASLPPRWQHVLWLTEVEELPHAEVAELLGTSANGVAALAFRARRGLQEAYLRQHLGDVAGEDCADLVEQLPAYLAGRVSRPKSREIEAHLADCGRCRAAVARLRSVTTDLGAALIPVVLGAETLGGQPQPPAASTGPSLGLKAVIASTVVAMAGLTGWWLAASPGREPEPAVAATPAPAATITDPATTGPATTRRTPTPAPPSAAPPVERSEPAPSRSGAEPTAATTPTTKPSRSPRPTAHKPRPTRVSPPPPETAAAADPRLGTPQVSESPRGAQWRRVVVPVAGAVPGVKVAVDSVGASAYCTDAGCIETAADRTWLATVAVPAGDSELVLDVRPQGAVRAAFHLTGSGWSDADTSNDATEVSLT